MTMRFSKLKRKGGWYIVVAETAHNVTIIVCECESRDLAQYLVQMLNDSDRKTQRQILLAMKKEMQPVLEQTA